MSFLPNSQFLALYFAYTISCLGDRIWSFSIIFVLAELGGLRLVTINQLFQGLAQMILASYVGNWYDHFGRQLGVQLCLGFNNLAVAASAALLAVTLHLSKTSESYGYLGTLTGSICLCAISMAAASGEKLAFSKDWIVVMVHEDEGPLEDKIKQQKRLSAQNAILTVVDMLAAIVAPIGSGFVLKHLGLMNGCWIIVGWNVAAWAAESYLLFWIYRRVPPLSVKVKPPETETEVTESKAESRLSILQMFQTYFNQSVFPAALGLSFLYMTVLAFDGISISFGEREGFDASILGIFQSVGSAFGMAAALSFPFIATKLDLHKAAFIGLTAELLALGVCVASVFLPGSPFDLAGYFGSITFQKWWKTFLDTFKSSAQKATRNETAGGLDWSKFEVNNKPADSLFSLFSGIALARFGLWLTDLAITQIMQESVVEEKRGTIFGVENALCQFFSVSKDIIAILLPDSKTFGLLVFVSVGAVAAAFLLFLCHLLSFKKKQT